MRINESRRLGQRLRLRPLQRTGLSTYGGAEKHGPSKARSRALESIAPDAPSRTSTIAHVARSPRRYRRAGKRRFSYEVRPSGRAGEKSRSARHLRTGQRNSSVTLLNKTFRYHVPFRVPPADFVVPITTKRPISSYVTTLLPLAYAVLCPCANYKRPPRTEKHGAAREPT